MVKKFYLMATLVAVIALCLGLAGPAQAELKLKYGHNAKQDQPTGQAALKFAELVKEKTNGEVTVMVFPANQLGKNRQMVENLKMGAQDIATLGLAGLGYIMDDYLMMQVPYVFRSQEHIHSVLNGKIGQDLKAELDKKAGIVLLAQDWDRMVRHIGGRKKIETLGDFKGYKVRAGVLPPIAAFKAMGASPVKIPLNEMYVALQQGVVDGAELPIDYFYEYSIYEVAPYLNLTYHTYGTQFVGINKRVWNKMTPGQQKAVQEAADEAGRFNNELVAKLQDDYTKKLSEAGMEMVKTDVDQFNKVLQDKIEEIAENWPGTLELYKNIQKVN